MGVTNNYCRFSLTKDYEKRPKYGVLLRDPFIKRYASEHVDVAEQLAIDRAKELFGAEWAT